MSLQPGDHLGPYEIAGFVGAGGMGEVYRARDPRLNRDVAIKVLHASVAADPERLRRFTAEAQAVAALNHPNVLTVYEVGTQGEHPFLATELLEGATLRATLEAGALPLSKAIDYARQTAAGLAAAHAKGVAHRDIKPENLFLTSDGRIKILDFGLAKTYTASQHATTEAAHAQTGTSPGTVLGTVGYMSPEQVRARPTDHRTDIFSLGVVLYEMLAGGRPFGGESAVETMNAILTADPPDIVPSGRTLPPNLAGIVRHCLEKNPDERFQSARDLSFALQSVSGTSGSSASGSMASHPGSGAQASLPAAPAPARRAGWIPLGVVAVLAAGVGAALALWQARPT
jgi:serine/threonine protein kinase